MGLGHVDDDSDDPVIQEFDVYLTKSLQNVYLLQHPIRPKEALYDETHFVKTRIKPIQKAVEMEIQLNTLVSTYDMDRGREIADKVDRKSKENEKYFHSDFMDKQILRSVKSVPNASLFAVGCLKDGEIHMTPLESIIQMRPAFEYLDQCDAKPKEKNKDDGSSDEEEVTHSVTVKFANSDKEKARRMTEKSFRHHQQTLDDEQWIDVVLNKNNSSASKFGRKSLVYNYADRPSINFCAASKDYVEILLPKEIGKGGSADSLIQLRSLPLGDQVNALIKNAKVIDFWKLLSLLSSDIEPGAVARIVQEVAVLVQGCWVIKSDCLYPKEARGTQTEVNGEVLIRCRDFVLWKFTSNRFANRKEMAAATKLPAADLKEILENVATCRGSEGWEFLLPTSFAFIKKYPEIVERQQKLWDLRFKKLMRDSDKKNASAVPKSPRKRSHVSESSQSQPEEKDAPTPEGWEELDSLVRETINKHICLSNSELKRLIVPKSAFFSRGVSDLLVAKAAEAAGASLLQVKFPNDGQQDMLYALVSRGDSSDSLRTSLVDMFKANSRYRKKNIQKKIEEESKTSLSESELADLLKDFCVNRNGWYYLKGVL